MSYSSEHAARAQAGPEAESALAGDVLGCLELFREGPVALSETGAISRSMTEIVQPMPVSLDPPTIALAVPLAAMELVRSRRVDVVALDAAGAEGGADIRCRGLLRAAVVTWIRGGNTHRLVVLEVTAARAWPNEPVRWEDRYDC